MKRQGSGFGGSLGERIVLEGGVPFLQISSLENCFLSPPTPTPAISKEASEFLNAMIYNIPSDL